MDLRFAKISNQSKNRNKPENAQAEMKGGRGVCSLVESKNTAKADGEKLSSKINKIVVESYMKKPSLKDEAMKKIFEFANNGILVEQSPMYPCTASVSSVFILKNKYVYSCAGDCVIFHFVNGKLRDVFENNPDEEPMYLGSPRYTAPIVSEAHTFEKGENTFLICSKEFADDMSENLLEETLSRATHTKNIKKHTVKEVKCDRWLSMLADSLRGFESGNENLSAIAFSIPEKRKKPKWVIIIIAIVLALIIGLFGFGALGRMKAGPDPNADPSEQNQSGFSLFRPKRPEGQPGVEGQEGMPPGPEGMDGEPQMDDQQRFVDENGNPVPPPPTRPPLNN